MEDEDEVLLVLGEELGNFVEYVGGAEHAHVLLAPLEVLCAAEENSVREKAVEAICKIGDQIPPKQFKDKFVFCFISSVIYLLY